MPERECPNIGSCEMFRLFRLSGSLAVWKINYCAAQYENCARYQRTKLGHAVPISLLPNGEMLKKPGG